MDQQIDEGLTRSSDPLLEGARAYAGVDYLFPFQRLVIANTLDAVSTGETELRRQIVVLPTGSGKTLCFMLPASMLSGVTIVVYPLLALMKDQARRAEQARLPHAVLRGGQSREEQSQLLRRVRDRTVKLLITNPEMLCIDRVQKALATAEIDHLVIDEAHCVSEWGESFRPSYLELGPALTMIDPTVVTAFTATASPRVLESIAQHLYGNEPARLVLANPDRANISYSVLHCYSKLHALRVLLSHPSVRRPAIVFCRSRTRTEEIGRALSSAVDFAQVASYHAGLEKRVRSAIESWFFDATDGILVSTCAYGMGVDKANVRTVIHYDPPASVEAFLQESGRAGRDRTPAESVLLLDPHDHRSRGIRARADQLLDYAISSDCRRAFLMRCMGSISESCFGCDRCSPEQRPAALKAARAEELAGASQILRAVRRRPRTLGPDDLIHAGEQEAERRQLIASLLEAGMLTACSWWPWKGLLQTGRR